MAFGDTLIFLRNGTRAVGVLLSKQYPTANPEVGDILAVYGESYYFQNGQRKKVVAFNGIYQVKESVPGTCNAFANKALKCFLKDDISAFQVDLEKIDDLDDTETPLTPLVCNYL